jgi:dephospho-CoA kinase
MGNSVIVGLTGSIAMGKSTSADLLRQMGIPVHCSDIAARESAKKGGAAYNEIVAAFDDLDDLRAPDGELNRQILGAFVFANPDRKAQLEAIIHPVVQQSQQDFIRDHSIKGADIVVLDIPLLFETGAENRLDLVICVTAPAHIQRQRIMARDNMTAEKCDDILKSQMPDADKQRLSDYVVSTGLGIGETRLQLKDTIQNIRSRIPALRNAPHKPAP